MTSGDELDAILEGAQKLLAEAANAADTIDPVEEFLKLAARCELQPGEIAHMAGVSRVTASRWMNGHSTPTRFLSSHLTELAERIDLAREEGALPLPQGLAPAERKRLLAIRGLWR